MEWGHEKNEKQPTRTRDIQCVQVQCVRIQCVLSSSVYCVRPAPGVAPLSSIDHRFQRLDNPPSIGAGVRVRTPRNIISSNVSNVSGGGAMVSGSSPEILVSNPFPAKK